jgi:hypothetical protein
LQCAADAYCSQVLAKGTTAPGRSVDHQANLSAYERYRKENLFDRSAAMSKVWTGDGVPVGVRKDNVAFSNAFTVMQKMAEDRFDADPTRTVEMHFSDIYSSGEYADLAKADRDFNRSGGVDPASAALQKSDGRTIPSAESDTDDGDAECTDDLDGSADDSDEESNMDVRGDRGEPAASSSSGGRSSASYVQGHNTAHNSRSMAGGVRSSGSYDDKKRPPSAARR